MQREIASSCSVLKLFKAVRSFARFYKDVLIDWMFTGSVYNCNLQDIIPLVELKNILTEITISFSFKVP